MNINFDKTKHIVEKCWEIACTANLPAAGEMVQGRDFNSVRLALFQQLVGHLVPSNQVISGDTRVEMTDAKEPWEQ